jgi:hypothetical protein
VLALLQQILKHTKLDEHLFIELNKTPRKDSCFDDIEKARRDFGGLTKSICSCCNAAVIYSFFQKALKQALDMFQ